MRNLTQNLLIYLPTIRKALIAGIVTVVLSFLARRGITAEMTVGDAVRALAEFVVGSALVWLVPNKK